MSAQKPRPKGLFSAIAGLLSFSVLAGILVTVLVTPALAVTGITASSTIGIFDSLPEFIEIDQQPERNELFASYTGEGNVDGYLRIATIYNQNRQEVGWDDISEFARNATVDGEDRRFFEHGGVDIASIIRAAVGNVASGDIGSGASTISMQLVKNTFVQQALEKPTEKERKDAYDAAIATSFDRKLKEMKLAIGLEKKYSKQEILTAYLNIAFFGDNTYGIEAAAQRYYSTTAKDLTLPQAASLIAIVQYPNLRGLDKVENYPANQDRRDDILGNMLELGHITQQEFDEASATPVDETTVLPAPPANGCVAAHEYAKWFCDFVVKNVKNFASLGADEAEREANWKRGGYKLYTTLDMDVQVNAQNQTWAYAPNAETRLALGSATVSVQPGTGRVLVMTENKIFNDTLEGGGPTTSAVNYNTSFGYGGSSGIQTGSTYKVFTLINWLQNGKGLNERVNGSARTEDQAKFTDSCEDGGGWVGPYKFRNDAGEGGSYSVYRATTGSVNGAFVSMALQLDLCEIRHTAESLGIERADGTHLQTNPSSVLGTNEVTPLSMAAAYAGIAANGLYCVPVILDRVVDSTGAELPGQQKDCRQAISPDVAATAAYAMAGVMNGGTGGSSNPRDGVPIIGKTGTTDSSNQTWVITATTSVATAVWVGNSIGKYPMRNYRAAGVAGGLLRHVIMKSTMAVINGKYGGGAFPPPFDGLLNGSGATVPDVSGHSLEQAKLLLEGLGFAFVDGGQVNSHITAGKVVSTDPGAGSLIARGMTVTVYTSNGLMIAVPDVVSGSPDFTTAEATLNNAGFMDVVETCAVVEPADPRIGKVVSTDPAPGGYALPATQIKVAIGQVAICPP